MSRQIPIVVEPGYDDNFRNSRRGSAPDVNTMPRSSENVATTFEDPARRFSTQNRKFARRHSEDPNTHSWKTYNYHASPSFGEEGKFGHRRGSVPVNWGRTPGKRDRFQEIVERMMSANDDELLSGIMEQDFGPVFEVEEVTEEYQSPDGTTTTHKKINRSPSSPAVHVVGEENAESTKTFPVNYARDKNGCIEIPVQICRSETEYEKQDENREKTSGEKGAELAEEKEESRSEREYENENAAKEENTDADIKEENAEQQEHVVTITVDSTLENIEPPRNEETMTVEGTSQAAGAETKNSQDYNANRVEQTNEILNQDEIKISNIKKISDKLDKTHEQVEAFKPTGAKDSNKQFLILEELLMRALMELDAVEANGNKTIREARKSVVMRVQDDLKKLEKKRVPVD